jgi:hypothetical protein
MRGPSFQHRSNLLVGVVDSQRSRVFNQGAKAILDRAFKAKTPIEVEEELAELRELMATIKAGELPAPIMVIDPSIDEIRVAEDEQAEAARPRVAWMTELVFDGHAIESSLRYNRPKSIDEEQ